MDTERLKQRGFANGDRDERSERCVSVESGQKLRNKLGVCVSMYGRWISAGGLGCYMWIDGNMHKCIERARAREPCESA